VFVTPTLVQLISKSAQAFDFTPAEFGAYMAAELDKWGKVEGPYPQ
jgi:hypothetical protein